jgi:aminoglycoside phosphotransferase (APT) family kinase protein
LYEAGVPVPRPVLCEQDASILGGSFLIVTAIEDAVQGGDAFPELSGNYSSLGPEFGRELAQALARVHRVPGIPSKAAGESTPDEMFDLDRSVRAYHAMWQSLEHPPLSIAADLGFAWLLSHPLGADRPRSIVHGDVNIRNILVRDGHLAGLLDWELAHEGDPSEDIGYCRLMLLDNIIPWDEFVDAYIGAGGDPRACEPHAVSAFGLWGVVRNSVISTGCRNKVLKENYHDPAIAVAAWDYFLRIQRNAAYELKSAIELERTGKLRSFPERRAQ